MADALRGVLDCETCTDQSCFCQPSTLEAPGRHVIRSEDAIDRLQVECDMSGMQYTSRLRCFSSRYPSEPRPKVIRGLTTIWGASGL